MLCVTELSASGLEVGVPSLGVASEQKECDSALDAVTCFYTLSSLPPSQLNLQVLRRSKRRGKIH